jgi:hypothetical protein
MFTRPVYKRTRVKIRSSSAYVWPIPPGAYSDYLVAVRDALREIYEHEALLAAMPAGGDVVGLFSKGVSLART